MDIGDKVKAGDQYTSNIKKSTTWQQTASTALTGMSTPCSRLSNWIKPVSDGTTIRP